MTNNYIPNPRPLFDPVILENKEAKERLFMGSGSSGIIFDVTRRGIEINGYYEGVDADTKYTNLRKFVFIPWKEFDKIKQRAETSGKKDRTIPDFIDKLPDEKYLKTLPIVHINNRKYYIDGVRKERRLVNNPQNVYKF